MILFYQPLLPEVKFLDPEESKHCIKVLRKQSGDTINLIDGKGNFYTSTITQANHKKCEFEVTEVRNEKKTLYNRHIAIAPTKNIDRMEWFIEKAVEFGIDTISFINCDHSERKVLKLERLEKKAISAMKQSVKATLPKLNEMVTFNNFIHSVEEDLKCLAYVNFENPVHFKDKLSVKNHTLIMIGPEGDFSEREVEKALKTGFITVSLGESRLRTETAGIAAVHLMNL